MPSDPHSSRTPAWRKQTAAKDTKRSGAEREWRKGQAAPLVAKPHWTRRHKFALLALSVFVTFGALIWVVSLFRVPKPACLILVGARYDDDKLALPQNSAGWESLKQLQQLATAGPASFLWWFKAGRFNLLQENPIELRVGEDWDKNLNFDKIKERTVILYFALHGGADEKGPYLLPQDADLRDRPENRLRLAAVLDRLKQVPQKNILLVLDATQVSAYWPLGMVRNDFAHALTQPDIKKRLDSMPNLVVLSSSDVYQRSWPAEEFKTTAFAHFLIEGLKGRAADNGRDGPISALQLSEYVRKQVKQWIRSTKDDLQEPIRLGDERSAADALLTIVPRSDSSDAVPSDAAGGDRSGQKQLALLANTWATAQDLARQVPAPEVYSPHLWRRYLDLLLRHERVVRLGDEERAAELKGRLDRLAGDIRNARRLEGDLASTRYAFGMPAALGLNASTATAREFLKADNLVQRLNELWKTPREQLVQKWEDIKRDWDEAQKGAVERQDQLLVANQLSRLVLERAAQSPSQNLAKASELLGILNNPGNQKPTEVQFFNLLARDLNAKQLPEDRLLGRAINLTGLAGDTALAIKTEPAGVYTTQVTVHPYSEVVFPWIRKKTEQADESRRWGHDYLLAAKEQFPLADKYLTQSEGDGTEAGYAAARKEGGAVREALQTYQEVMLYLPYYSQWLARRHAVDPSRERKIDDELKQVENLWDNTHALGRLLKTPKPEQILRRTEAPTRDNPEPRSLLEQSREVRESFAKREQYFQTECKRLAGEIEYSNTFWRDLDDALTVPRIDVEDRKKMLANAARIGDKLNQDAQDVRTSRAEITKQEHQDSSDRFAQRQGRMALAALGPDLFDEAQLFKNRGEGYGQIQGRLKNFSSGSDHQRVPDLIKLGDEIGFRWQALPEEINRLTQSARTAKLEEAAPLLARAEDLARQLHGATVHLLANTDPVQEHRRLQVHDLLLWQAQRTWLDHYWSAEGVSTDPSPYYTFAGKQYLHDAERLLASKGADSTPEQTGRLTPLREMEKRLQAVPLTAVRNPPQRLDITRESSLALRYQLEPREQVPKGYPVVWMDAEASLDLTEQGRQVRETGAKDEVVFHVRSRDEQEPRPVPDIKPLKATLRGIFRGQYIAGEATLNLHLWPDIIVAEEPPPPRAGIALRADREVHDRFGLQNSAIAIVLDCSGSMQPAYTGKDKVPPRSFYTNYRRDTPCKYHDATTALRELLSELPKGVSVSLFVFSQAGVDAQGVPRDPQPYGTAEETITRLREPAAWDREELAPLMERVERLYPWNETPLVHAMWQAMRDGFPRNFKGFKTLLVLTDGMDNCFEEDAPKKYPGDRELHNKYGTKSISGFIEKAFRDSGIMINMIGFDVAPGEEETFKKQFEEPIKKLPLQGTFQLAKNKGQLRQRLLALLKPRLRFTLEEGGGRRAAGIPDEGGDVGRAPEAPRYGRLRPGTYTLRLQTSESPLPEQRVVLDNGDFLLLNVKSDGRSFERVLYGTENESPSLKGSKSDQGWLLGVHQNQKLENQPRFARVPATELLASLENEKDRAPDRSSSLKQERSRPQAVWFEVKPQGDEGSRFSLWWNEQVGYPAPAYGLNVTGWPNQAGSPELARPALSVWFNPDKDVMSAATALRLGGSARWRAFAGQQSQFGDDPSSKAVLESIETKQLKVKTRPDQAGTEVPCLVIQASYPPGDPVWIKLDERLKLDGQKHLFYSQAGKYTGIFWPLSEEQLEKDLKVLHLVSVNRFKRDALHIENLRLKVPDQEPRPDPLLSLTASE